MDDTLTTRLAIGQVAACNCGAKAPEPEHHSAICRYRLLCEAGDRIEALEAENARLREALGRIAQVEYELDEDGAPVGLGPPVLSQNDMCAEAAFALSSEANHIQGAARGDGEGR